MGGKCRPVMIETVDGVRRRFPSLLAAANYVHVTDVSIIKRIKSRKVAADDTMTWYADEPKPEFTVPHHRTRPRRVVARKGEKEYVFKSFLSCAEQIGSYAADVRSAALNNHPVKGWRISLVEEHLPKKEKAIAGLQLAPEEIRPQIGVKRPQREIRRTDNARHMPVTKKNIEYGFYDKDLGPVICPVCQMILSVGGNGAADKYLRHFEKCLAGRSWRLRVDGVIEVEKYDGNANKLAGKANFTPMKKSNEVWKHG